MITIQFNVNKQFEAFIITPINNRLISVKFLTIFTNFATRLNFNQQTETKLIIFKVKFKENFII